MTTRLRRAGAALAATSALAFSVSACGGDDAPATAVAPAAAPAATASSTASASTVSSGSTAGAAPVGLDDCQDKAPLDPGAVSTFGAAEVRNAYCTAVAVTLDTSYRSELVHYNPSKPHQASEFAFATQYMTSSSAQDWTKNVAAALATKTSDDDGPVNALTLFDGYYESPDAGVLTTLVQGPAAGDLVVTPDHVTLNRTQEFGDRLEVALTLTGNLLLAKPDGSTLYAPTVKTITYWMASGSNPTAPWLIDGLSGNVHFDGVSDTRPTPAATVPPGAGS